MAWNYQSSLDRIKQHVDALQDIEVEKLVREADLEGLLSETRCRQIYGAHTYVAVSNFSRLCSDGTYAEADYKRLIQGVHIYQREVARIVEGNSIFDGLRVHFQGPKLHALFYRPIDDSEELASRALLLQLVVKDFVKNVFNPAFPHYDNFIVSAGSAIGDVIGTRNGHRGDQELLFLGGPANYAAKIIGAWGSLRVDDHLYEALPQELRDLCVSVRDGVYRIETPGDEELDDLLEHFDIHWDPDASADRVRADKVAFPLKDIDCGEADVLIDLDQLSIRNNKRVLAASLFADIAGFTRYIDNARTNDQKKAALRVLHAIRKEMAAVIKTDFGGLRVQYQGDRVQGLFHLPKDDETRIAKKAVEAAIGLQSSMEYAIKEVLPEARDVSLAIGLDFGTTLVSKLGTRGHRDRICIGEAVERAALCEERCVGGQIGITECVFEALSEELQDQFTFDETAECYVATGLTAEKAERAARATVYAGAGPVFVRSDSRGVHIRGENGPDARRITPSRSWAE
jgi:class 3 adenylate cyclase